MLTLTWQFFDKGFLSKALSISRQVSYIINMPFQLLHEKKVKENSIYFASHLTSTILIHFAHLYNLQTSILGWFHLMPPLKVASIQLKCPSETESEIGNYLPLLELWEDFYQIFIFRHKWKVLNSFGFFCLFFPVSNNIICISHCFCFSCFLFYFSFLFLFWGFFFFFSFPFSFSSLIHLTLFLFLFFSFFSLILPLLFLSFFFLILSFLFLLLSYSFFSFPFSQLLFLFFSFPFSWLINFSLLCFIN